MSVIGVDIGAHSTYIAVAKLGGVDIINNDYSLRSTPSIVAYGDRQRYVGMAAENERNFNSTNSISNFKPFIGTKFANCSDLKDQFGAKAEVDTNGGLVFKVKDFEVSPEQCLATLFTKIKAIVSAAEDNDKIETLVVSVPVYFTQAQRQAVKDAASIAGLHLSALICDASALALEYGKSKEIKEINRNVMIIDVGSEGTQAFIAEFSSSKARILASKHNQIGGRVFDEELVEHASGIIEKKYNICIRDNPKAISRLKNTLEKTKKQMSANTNKIPILIDSLAEDVDVQFSIDREEFETLIKDKIVTIKQTVNELLAGSNIKPEDLHSIELVGGSTRIPAIKKVITEVTGIIPSSTLNADEAVARGCALHAASISNKFITRQYSVTPVVHYSIETILKHGAGHNKLLVCSKGDSITKPINSNPVAAELPLDIILQYAEPNGNMSRLIAMYKVDQTGVKTGMVNFTFYFNKYGMLELKEVIFCEKELTGQCRSTLQDATGSANKETCDQILDFTMSLPKPVNISSLRSKEERMVEMDNAELSRQEEKNCLEEQLIQTRHKVQENSDEVTDQEVYTNFIQYIDGIENWLYEEGKGAPSSTYIEIEETLQKKMKVFTIWLQKYHHMKAKDEEQNVRQQQINEKNQQSSNQERQIPIVYKEDVDYIQKKQRSPRFARQPDPFFSGSSLLRDSYFDW